MEKDKKVKKVTPAKVQKIHKYHNAQHKEIQQQIDFHKKRFDDLRKSFDKYKEEVAPQLADKQLLLDRITNLVRQGDNLREELETAKANLSEATKTNAELTIRTGALSKALTETKAKLDRNTKIPFMAVTRQSSISGKTNTLELPVTEMQLIRYELGDILLQDCFPQLTAPEREFIKSGITPEEWKETFGPNPFSDEEDEEDNNNDETFAERRGEDFSPEPTDDMDAHL